MCCVCWSQLEIFHACPLSHTLPIVPIASSRVYLHCFAFAGFASKMHTTKDAPCFLTQTSFSRSRRTKLIVRRGSGGLFPFWTGTRSHALAMRETAIKRSVRRCADKLLYALLFTIRHAELQGERPFQIADKAFCRMQRLRLEKLKRPKAFLRTRQCRRSPVCLVQIRNRREAAAILCARVAAQRFGITLLTARLLRHGSRACI